MHNNSDDKQNYPMLLTNVKFRKYGEGTCTCMETEIMLWFELMVL